MMTKTIIAFALILILPLCVAAQEADLDAPASWKQPTWEEAKEKMKTLLASQSDEIKVQAELIWTPADEGGMEADILERAALTASLFGDEIREFVSQCNSAPELTRVPSPDWKDVPAELAHNTRLFAARWMVQNDLYDEAKSELDAIAAESILDPATHLFYQAVVAHRLLDKTACVKATTKLLENEGVIPRRYEQLARLMAADIAPLKVDSPDEIARLMTDVERRLDLGRAGKRVRNQQAEIVDKLDKIIKQIEEQLQQQQQSSAGGQPSGQPANDSQAVQQQSAGDVQSKEHENRKSWGNLPPEQRRSTLQQISRELGAHYREVVEEYFRKIAQDSD